MSSQLRWTFFALVVGLTAVPAANAQVSFGFGYGAPTYGSYYGGYGYGLPYTRGYGVSVGVPYSGYYSGYGYNPGFGGVSVYSSGYSGYVSPGATYYGGTYGYPTTGYGYGLGTGLRYGGYRYVPVSPYMGVTRAGRGWVRVPR